MAPNLSVLNCYVIKKNSQTDNDNANLIFKASQKGQQMFANETIKIVILILI